MPPRRVLLALVLVALGLGAGTAAWVAQHRRPTATLQDPNPAVRLRAVRAMSPGGDTDLLIEALRDENADVRLVAAQRLRGRGPDGGKRAAALVEALKDPHAGVRREAAESLYSIGPDAEPVLVRALADPGPRARAGAALALAVVCGEHGLVKGPEEEEAVTALLCGLLRDGDVEVRRNAATALGRLVRGEPEARRAVPRLREALGASDDIVRAAAVAALGSISRSAEARPVVVTVLPAVQGALKDRSWEVRRAAAWALLHLNPQSRETARALLDTVKGGRPGTLDSVETELKELESRFVIPELAEALKDKNDEVRYAAAHILWGMRHKARPAIPALVDALKDPSANVRWTAAAALGAIGPESGEAVPALTRLLGDRDRTVRRAAALSLWEVDRQAEAAVPVLIEALRDEDWRARESAAYDLREMGPAAQAAIPALREAQGDESPNVRHAAGRALEQIAPGQ